MQICNYTLGYGLLFIPSVYARMGFAAGACLVLSFSCLSCYSILLAYRFKHEVCPTARSYGDASTYVTGPKAGALMRTAIEGSRLLFAFTSFELCRASIGDCVDNVQSLLVTGEDEPQLALPRGIDYAVSVALILSASQIRTMAAGSTWLALPSSLGVMLAIILAFASFAISSDSTSLGLIDSSMMGEDVTAVNAAGQHNSPSRKLLGQQQEVAIINRPDELTIPLELLNAGKLSMDPVLSIMLLFMIHGASLEYMGDMKDSVKFRRAAITAFSASGTFALGLCCAAVALFGTAADVKPYFIANCDVEYISLVGNGFVLLKAVSTYLGAVIHLQQAWLVRLCAWGRDQ